ncbi:MAG: helix-turn-helix domain-containing protein [Candidatus Ornithomonoglobus sp.]
MSQRNIKEIIAENMKYYREQNKLTKKAVAEYLGVSASSVTHWEDGSNSIDINKLSKLCELLKCKISDIVTSREQEDDSALSEQEQELISIFGFLNPSGKSKVIEYIHDLYENPKYVKSTVGRISDDIVSDLNRNITVPTSIN